jgi:hypothetical protein
LGICAIEIDFLNVLFGIWQLYRGSLWHVHIHIHCIPVWFILYIILPLLPLPFSKWLWQVSVFHIHTCIENKLTIFTLLYPLHLPSLSYNYPSLNMTCFIFLSFIVLVPAQCLLGFCLGILPVNMLYFSQSNPLFNSFLSFSDELVFSTVFSVFCVS